MNAEKDAGRIGFCDRCGQPVTWGQAYMRGSKSDSFEVVHLDPCPRVIPHSEVDGSCGG